MSWRSWEPFRAVAIDFDGTLTRGPEVDPDVIEAVRGIRGAGRRAVLVTGRILTELQRAFPGLDTEFDAVVAENGAVLAHRGKVRDLAPPVDPSLPTALARRNVSVRPGRVLVAGRAADEVAVQEEIAQLGLDCQLVRNRSELMVLPTGVTKGTGLGQAFGELKVSAHNAVGIGDAENDQTLLEVCELGVAVADAVEDLTTRADVVLDEPDGAGVASLLRDQLLAGKLRPTSRRWRIELGRSSAGEPVFLPASQTNMVIAGGSFSGKSHAVGLLVEQLIGLGYIVVVLDVEGDHVDLAALAGVAVLGSTDPLQSVEQLDQFITPSPGGVVLDLSLMPSHEQERYLHAVADHLVRHYADTGLPHWVVVEEAHLLLAHDGPAYGLIASAMGLCAATYRPNELSDALDSAADAVIAVAGTGLGTEETATYLAGLTGQSAERLSRRLAGTATGDALVAHVGQPEVTAFRVAARRTGHVRHQRKYAAHLGFFLRVSELGELHSVLACCPGTTVDFHARRHDFSRWIGDVLGDGALAATVADIETQHPAEPAAPENTRGSLLAILRPTGHAADYGPGEGGTPGEQGFFFHISELGELHSVLACCPGTTVDFHARRHDFSRWIGDVLGDGALAATVADIETQHPAEPAAPENTRGSLLEALDARHSATSTVDTSP